MTYTCAVFPTEDATLEQAQHYKYDLVARKLGLEPGMRLLDVGCGWGGMVRHAAQQYGVKALGVTLSREQATWAQEKIKEMGLDHLAEVRHSDYREVTETGFDAVSSIGLTEHIGVRNYPAYFGVPARPAAPAGPAAQPLHHPPAQPAPGDRRVHRPLRLPRRRADRLGQDHHRGPERRPRGAARGELPAALRPDPGRLVPQPRGELGRVRRRGRRGHGAGLGPLHGRLAAGLRAQRDPAPPRAGDQDRRRRATTATRCGPRSPRTRRTPPDGGEAVTRTGRARTASPRRIRRRRSRRQAAMMARAYAAPGDLVDDVVLAAVEQGEAHREGVAGEQRLLPPRSCRTRRTRPPASLLL